MFALINDLENFPKNHIYTFTGLKGLWLGNLSEYSLNSGVNVKRKGIKSNS